MSWSYKFEVNVSRNLEKIVGQKKMEILFLKGSLIGLINELKNYSTEKEIMGFISSVDLISSHYNDINIFKNKIIQKSIYTINLFLLKAYNVKLNQEFNNKKITKDEYEEELQKYIESLGMKTRIPIKSYDNFPKKKKIKGR